MTTNSKFILTSTEDPELFLWTLKGEQKANVQSSQVKYNSAKFSPDCRYLGIASLFEFF